MLLIWVCNFFLCCFLINTKPTPTIGIAESSIQFVLYEKMKSLVIIQKREILSLQGALTSTSAPTLSNGEYMALAATAKLIAAICTYPHEV